MADWGRIGRGILSGGLTEAYAAATGQGGYGQPIRQSPYGQAPQTGYADLPGYGAREGSLQTFATSRGGGAFREGQEELSNLLLAQARGEQSFSGEQLRQAVSRLQGQQQSIAASARPSQAAMAARIAAQNAGRLGSELAGQQALAGIAERTQAAQAAGGVLGQGRSGDIESYLGAQRISAQQAADQAGQRLGEEELRVQRYEADLGVPSRGEGLIGAIGSLGQLAAKVGGTGSDEQNKKNIGSGQRQAQELLDAVEPRTFEGRAFGAGVRGAARGLGVVLPGRERQLGVLAQDVEGAAPGAVRDTAVGKVIEPGPITGAVLAGLGRLNQRLDELEERRQSAKDPKRQAGISVVEPEVRERGEQSRAESARRAEAAKLEPGEYENYARQVPANQRLSREDYGAFKVAYGTPPAAVPVNLGSTEEQVGLRFSPSAPKRRSGRELSAAAR